jgi:ubiquinone/menaquinone biosynthesis C-methylase UbiE
MGECLFVGRRGLGLRSFWSVPGGSALLISPQCSANLSFAGKLAFLNPAQASKCGGEGAAVKDQRPSFNSDGQDHAGLRKRVHAWMLSKANAKYERAVADYKRTLLGELSGKVLEIGPGGGVNLPYYPPGIHWTGVEANRFMHPYLRKKAESLGLSVELRLGNAEHLDFDDSTLDAVAGTLVLCSVANPAASLREILRVLRPGGRFVFIEHVAAPPGSGTRRRQGWVKPVWRFLGDGCYPDRETWTAIEEAGFDRVRLTHFRVPFPIIGPHIAGVGFKKANRLLFP